MTTPAASSIMSDSQLFAAMPTTTSSSEEALRSVAPTVMAPEWYAAGATPFQNQYMTPFSTAPLDGHKWTPHTDHHVLEPSANNYTFGATLPMQQHYVLDPINRPRSSPSTFGPAPDSIDWPTSNALRIQYDHDTLNAAPILPSNSYDQFSSLHQLSAPNTPELRQPVPRKPYTSIAPNPAMAIVPSSHKRRHESVEPTELSDGSTKRRKRTSSVHSADMSEDDRYLVQLKEDESLPWKEIATRFQSDKGKSFQVAALQMRYKRLREKFRVWEEQDVNALRMAHEHWQKYKWEIISQKMTEFGNPERWPARTCARKWHEMELTLASSMAMGPAAITTSLAQFPTSPVEVPLQYPYLPIH